MTHMKDSEFYDSFEHILEDGLIKVCRGAGLVGDTLLRSDDIDGKWDDYIKDYVADAVENFNQYPEAAISWAAFLGIGVAHWWDANWQGHKNDSYSSFYGSRGWDDMDEHVLRDLLGLKLDGKEAKRISDTMLSCALATLGLLRHEGIETQTERGFFVLTRSYSVLYRIGAGIELQRLGYKAVPIQIRK